MTEVKLLSREEARARGVTCPLTQMELSRLGTRPSRLWAIEETDRRLWEKPHTISYPTPKKEQS